MNGLKSFPGLNRVMVDGCSVCGETPLYADSKMGLDGPPLCYDCKKKMWLAKQRLLGLPAIGHFVWYFTGEPGTIIRWEPVEWTNKV